jgi:hypothetical protein
MIISHFPNPSSSEKGTKRWRIKEGENVVKANSQKRMPESDSNGAGLSLR